MRSSRWLLLAAAVFAACTGGRPPASAPAPSAPTTRPAPTTPASAKPAAVTPQAEAWIVEAVTGALDTSVDPCQDFYQFACGGWNRKTTRPADRARWTRSFSVIDEGNRALIREVLDDSAKNPGADPDRQRVGAYYSACMDEAAIEAKGTSPLQPMFSAIAAVRDWPGLFDVAGRLQRYGAGPLFGMGVYPDFKNPDTEIAFFAQGGLGLPERDYYVSDDENQKALRKQYQDHIARSFLQLGDKPADAAQAARDIVAFETELARASRTNEEMRQVDKLYNRLDLAGLQKLTPKLPWGSFFTGLGAPTITQINVGTPEFFTALEARLAKTPMSTLRSYLRWHWMSARADELPKAFVDANFAFFGKALFGQEQIEDRWKRCVDATGNALGFSLGKVYVDKAFPGESKAKALEMIQDIQDAFEQSLPKLAWMDDATRQRALEKKNALGEKIGYPDQWRDYSSMKVTRDDHFANVLASNEFETLRQAAKIGKPVDRGEWGMTPQEVNAYYNPLMNEIAFPAGILQPPFFHKDYPAAMNYGAIGMVVGHELSHAFDDTGRKFDPKGRMQEWWEPAVAEKFETQANCLRAQYSAYEVETGLKANGELTAGENIADNGGLKQAFVAYKNWEKRNGGVDKVVPGMTNDQLFFVAFAQGWCSLSTAENDRWRVANDVHSLPRHRVLGPVVNHPEFGRVFQCKTGTPMNPEQKCVLW
jgi:putative endopeptidase